MIDLPQGKHFFTQMNSLYEQKTVMTNNINIGISMMQIILTLSDDPLLFS